jgi:hypothetical protein
MKSMLTLQIIAIVFSLGLIGFVVEAVRRNRLKERYALLWLGAGVILLILSAHRPSLDWAARMLGVSYPPSLLFLVAFVFLFAIVMHYSLVVSGHRDRIRQLTQRLALLTYELEQLREQIARRSASPP